MSESWPEYKCRHCGVVADDYRQWISCERICRKLKKSRQENSMALGETSHGDECPLCKSGTVEVVNGEVRCMGECGNVEDSMADSFDNNSPLVKLVEAILDDESGIKDMAYSHLITFLKQIYGSRPLPSRLQKMLDVVEGTDGRVYIGEDWEDDV